MSAELATLGSSASRWKPCPAYKDSNVEWLGTAPLHWEVKRLKDVVKINPEDESIINKR